MGKIAQRVGRECRDGAVLDASGKRKVESGKLRTGFLLSTFHYPFYSVLFGLLTGGLFMGSMRGGVGDGRFIGSIEGTEADGRGVGVGV